jgi:inward rectifier potassium channel
MRVSPLFPEKPTVKKAVQVQIGDTQAVKVGITRFNWRDPYYAVLTATWVEFFSLVLLFYILTNLIFGALYFIVPGSVAGVSPGSFLDDFFFSVETLATVGYGTFTPHTLYGHLLASLETFCGLLLTAMITGLVFARFSRPQARMLFSDVAVIAPYEGKTAVMIRVVSERSQGIADASAKMLVLREFRTADGHVLRRFTDLPLQRAYSPIIALSWTLIHVIDENSPLWGKSPEDFKKNDVRIFISLGGYDEAISAPIVTRKSYSSDHIRFGHGFEVIMTDGPDGRIILDLTRFHNTRLMGDGEKPNIGDTSVPADNAA